jgi:nucleoside-diphosphate-sugar epimerase
MEKVLVTGGAGYVGSALVPTLLERGHRVEVLDSMIYDNSYTGLSSYINGRNLISHPHFYGLTKGDVRNKELVSDAVKRSDTIIHLAAIVGAPACAKNSQDAKSINVEGTRNVLESLSNDQRIIFASTGSNYGAVEEICTEDTPLNPLSVYGETKTQSEREVREVGGIAYRFATAFGVAPKYRMDLLPNDFAHKLLNGSLDIYEPNARRTFIHVADMTNAFLFGMKNFDLMGGEAFNVGDESMNITKEGLAQKIISEIKNMYGIDTRLITFPGEARVDPDARDYEVSYEKIKKISEGFRTKVSLDDGLKEVIKFSELIKIRNPFSNV